MSGSSADPSQKRGSRQDTIAGNFFRQKTSNPPVVESMVGCSLSHDTANKLLSTYKYYYCLIAELC